MFGTVGTYCTGPVPYARYLCPFLKGCFVRFIKKTLKTDGDVPVCKVKNLLPTGTVPTFLINNYGTVGTFIEGTQTIDCMFVKVPYLPNANIRVTNTVVVIRLERATVDKYKYSIFGSRVTVLISLPKIRMQDIFF